MCALHVRRLERVQMHHGNSLYITNSDQGGGKDNTRHGGKDSVTRKKSQVLPLTVQSILKLVHRCRQLRFRFPLCVQWNSLLSVER
jgi:hypothetical protein